VQGTKCQKKEQLAITPVVVPAVSLRPAQPCPAFLAVQRSQTPTAPDEAEKLTTYGHLFGALCGAQSGLYRLTGAGDPSAHRIAMKGDTASEEAPDAPPAIQIRRVVSMSEYARAGGIFR
jgi:hypothetical protein